jgi:hypothetical protein
VNDAHHTGIGGILMLPETYIRHLEQSVIQDEAIVALCADWRTMRKAIFEMKSKGTFYPLLSQETKNIISAIVSQEK